jgi:methionyl-tRNA formyltransferase
MKNDNIGCESQNECGAFFKKEARILSVKKKTNVILTSRSWHEWMLSSIQKQCSDFIWILLRDDEKFTQEFLHSIQCEKVFIPHWSRIISDDILQNFECVIFHMTDLPYGRGGSPLQNLIVRGHRETQISALRADAGIDTGPIYCKSPLTLDGTAQEIFERASLVIEKMIVKIITEDMKPTPQQGNPLVFKRRNPSEGDLANLKSIESIYDYIRMLDCPGYPPAFIETPFLKLEFHDAKLGKDGMLDARVTFIPRK